MKLSVVLVVVRISPVRLFIVRSEALSGKATIPASTVPRGLNDSSGWSILWARTSVRKKSFLPIKVVEEEHP